MRIHSTYLLSFFILLLTPSLSYGQLNMVLQDSMDYNVGVNDVCGWAAPDGKEYALVGLNTGVSIVDINSDTIHEVVFVPGVDNLWRDINTFGHYAYVSSEAYIGLLIIDLQFLPDSVQTYVWMDSLPTPTGNMPFLKAHSLWTDENGFLYLNGSNLNSGGVIMLDVASSPTDPVFLGYGPPIYAHDCFSRDSIIYSAEIYAGNASIYDAHDPQNITLLGQVKTPYEFTHNAWLSDNSKYMFTTDERANSYVTSYDITDPTNIIELDRYRQASTDGLGNIVHNVYVWDDWIVAAYYANGTVILDGSRPDNLVEVGNFDSFLGADGGFPGVWGSYPFLPSGKILSSDRNNGLFVFIPNYVRACFLEGIVIDSVTNLPIGNATVTIESSEIVFPQSTKPDGGFKMGKAIPGQYNIRIEKEGYHVKHLQAHFINGEILTPTVKLIPLQVFSFGGKVIDEGNANVPFAKVSLVGNEGVYETTCDVNGLFFVPAVFDGSYALQAGIWGATYETQINMNEPKDLTLQLAKGYKDDFDVDLGWAVLGQVTSGMWARGIPTRQLLFENIECGADGDSPFDLGGVAYSTGLSTSPDAATDEVSGGTTWLVSPPMDLTEAIAPKISFDYWLCEYPPNQYIGIQVWISNGVDTFLLDELRNDTFAGSWQPKLYENLPLQEPLDQIQFMISARDTTAGVSDYYLKAHFDNFKLTEGTSATGEVVQTGRKFMVYPNPSNGETFYLKPISRIEGEMITLNLYDVNGRSISFQKEFVHNDVIRLDQKLEGGVYLLHWSTDKGATGVEKILVLKP